ncbi:MAG: hypothetical protein ACKVOP_01790 [Sphingomonadaceae bacterium]
MTTIFRQLTLAVVLVAAPSGLRAEQEVAKIAITPQSEMGAILIKSPDLPLPPMHRTSYRLLLQIYDPVAQQMKGGLLGGSAILASRPKLFADGFLALALKPGTYAITSFSRQDWWTLCFQDASLQFTVKPGEVSYLGDFQADKQLAELTQMAISTGRTSTRGSPVDFFDGVPPPALLAADEKGLAEAVAMVKRRMLQTTVSPVAATISPARFGTGSTLFGGKRCGGYFQTKAK